LSPTATTATATNNNNNNKIRNTTRHDGTRRDTLIRIPLSQHKATTTTSNTTPHNATLRVQQQHK
jgi:hypothetical protein